MATVNIYVGCNDKDTRKQMYDLTTINNMIIDIVKEFYDSFSIQLIGGVYKGEVENTYKVSIMFDLKFDEDINTAKLSYCIRTLRDKLNQECIMVEIIKDSIISFV